MPHHPEVKPASQESRPWFVPVTTSFFDHDLNDSERVIWLALDMMARLDMFCFPSHETLAVKTKRKPRAVRDAIQRLAAKGYVKTVHVGSKKSSRVGIVLKQRVNPEANPAADTPAKVTEAELALKARRSRRMASECQPGWHQSAIDRSQQVTEQLQRINLENSEVSETSQDSYRAHSGYVVELDSEDEYACVEEKARIFEIAKSLRGMSRGKASPLIDEFAVLCLRILFDIDPIKGDEESEVSYKNHCKFGWKLVEGKLKFSDMARCLEAALRGGKETGVENMAAHYNKAVGALLGIETDEDDCCTPVVHVFQDIYDEPESSLN